MFIMVVGGLNNNWHLSYSVELVSLDTENNPVPSRLQNLGSFPKKIEWGSRGTVTRGTYCPGFDMQYVAFLFPANNIHQHPK
jgi:hypothetical protein